MSELHLATVIADADLADDVEFPVRLAATPGLLQGTFAKLKTYLLTALIGHLVPSGGTTGQVLKKASGTDYDIGWGADNVGSGGPTTLDGLTDVDTSTVAPIDGDLLRFDNASGLWKPHAAASGGSGVYPPLSPPLSSALTLNSGDATNLTLTNDADVGLIFDWNSAFTGASLSRIATMALPTGSGAGPGDTDWSFFAEVRPTQANSFGSVGLHLYESATGKQIAFGLLPANGLYAWGAASLTGFATTIKQINDFMSMGRSIFVGFKYIQATGIYYMMVSADGKNWTPWTSATRAASFTTRADRVGFGVMNGAASTMVGDKRLGSCRWFSKSW